MSGRHQHIVPVALLVIAIANSAIAQSSELTSPTLTLDQLAKELDQTRAELKRLRQRDRERSVWEQGVSAQLSSDVFREASYSPNASDGYCSDCGKNVCQGVPHLCGVCLDRLSWNKKGGWRVTPFGKLEVETFFTTDSTVADNYIVFAQPRALTKTERMDVTGQSTQIGLSIEGPCLGSFQVGGTILMDFHGNRPSRNEPGAYFIRGYAELFNDNWRFAFGQMGDTIGGWNADTVNWSGLGGLGFLGANQRGTLRVDRHLYPSDMVQWTLTGALTQPVVTDLAGFNDTVGQDNGLPNFEGQVVLGLGPDCGEERPLQLSISGMYGEYFSAAFNSGLPVGVTNTSKAYAIAGALQWTGQRMGVRAQVWNGRGLGTYMGGISQTINTETGETIRATGGFAQVWLNVYDRARISFFGGIDDPLNADLSVTDNQRVRNQLLGGNIFYNVSDYFQLGLDVWGVQTDFARPGNDNDVVVVMTEAAIAF